MYDYHEVCIFFFQMQTLRKKLLETSSSIEIIAMRNQKIILMKDWTDHSPYSQCPNPQITLSIELYAD